jgi:hypothetical protein
VADSPSTENSTSTGGAPAPEVLKPRSNDTPVPETPDKPATPIKRGNYRPSHKATFIGLAVVGVILAFNAVIIGFVLKGGNKSDGKNNDASVTISQAALDKLGVNRSSVGDLGVQLVVNPDSKFNGKLTVGGDTSIGGQLKLNNKLFAADASFTQFESGTAALNTLNVNSDTTLSKLSLRNDFTVSGKTTLQGPLTVNQLLTVNGGLNLTGNLAVGGILSVNTFRATSLTADNGLTFGGHVVTKGSSPGVSRGSATGSNGTVSISGNDASGTIGVNIGVGASAGTLVSVTFNRAYGETPHVVVTPVGRGVGSFYVNRTATGFSISVEAGLSPGGYGFDYIVQQ